MTVASYDLVKRKRQIRDHFNKNTHDKDTIEKVAEVISFPEKRKEKEDKYV